MALIVHRIIVVVNEVPAKEIVDESIAFIIRAVCPAGIRQEVEGIDITVSVSIEDKRGICRSIEVDEREAPVAVGVVHP